MKLSLSALSKYHPVVIEGMGGYDPRNPAIVAETMYLQLQQHWSEDEGTKKPPTKPVLVITQGDPLSERGISAITPRVADMLGVSRALVCLDPHIVPYHSPNADRKNVEMEFWYSEMKNLLDDKVPQVVEGREICSSTIIQELEKAIDDSLREKNEQRQANGKPPLKDYYRDFALLQEVTKAACFQICGEITVAHTASHISEFSVTSFYKTGLQLGLIKSDDMVHYPIEESFDFETIDKR
eukprot:CAMPEP_0198145236 /NCGR_PEP_ID=MMETSP1443-20131203/22122_1 /TAXON_ID=186043 /ORGANISM="Entomoneis sp., Strain CCMP2396" /LENGTH=239 /DNA_ID=CAMNT_0043808815 /DNA_START=37 /DNA_END=756 /DNA_ORIENTATION=+